MGVLRPLWLTIHFRKVLIQLLREMKKAVKILMIFFFFSFLIKIFLKRLLTITLKKFVSISLKYFT